ncbi:hypothetical protein ACUXI4_004058 [Pantoea piersonii]
MRFNILFTTAAAFQHCLLLIQRQLFKQPAELIGQFTAGDALRMFGAQLVGEIASQVAEARAPIDQKYRDAYSTHIPAVILAVNNNPMRFSDRSGGVSRRRVILTFPEVIPAKERDPQLLGKISTELAVIVRHLMQRFSSPNEARELLQAKQTSGEALDIKRQADLLVDFCGYLIR